MNDKEVDILLAEYEACNEGYNSRDTIVSAEFPALMALFAALVASVTYVTDIIIKYEDPIPTESRYLLCIFYIIIFSLGFIFILGISIDMQSTHSCKISIRKRLIEIEHEINKKINSDISSRKPMRLWSVAIEEREKRYLLEKIFKFERHKGREREIILLTFAVYILIFSWIFIMLAFYFRYIPGTLSDLLNFIVGILK